ncbi:MAG: dTDP-4-dehydrorhamnose 3,5-epimerase family protein, partial [Candidatus Aenigmarchaeota archaeon]|nr:dTDP-4-dehydrorhamnose 3,5-epimerase family protein [Candidatus Aenigmarchaeota archaeon]
LVRCIRGEIYDVAVDLRKDSPTYGKWKGVRLSEENKNLLFVPRGFGHAFYTLSDVAEVEYLADRLYDPASEGGVIWNDPDLKIEWPLEGKEPTVSDKDSKWPGLKGL